MPGPEVDANESPAGGHAPSELPSTTSRPLQADTAAEEPSAVVVTALAKLRSAVLDVALAAGFEDSVDLLALTPTVLAESLVKRGLAGKAYAQSVRELEKIGALVGAGYRPSANEAAEYAATAQTVIGVSRRLAQMVAVRRGSPWPPDPNFVGPPV